MPRRPLRALSVLFVGFVSLVLVSQLSSYFYAQAILAYYPNQTASAASLQNASTLLAYSAGALGLAFSLAVLLVARGRLDSEIRVYRMTGLSRLSALRMILSSHPVRPIASALAAGILGALLDASLGLDAYVPLALALTFASLLLVWLSGLTLLGFSSNHPGTARGRVG